MMSTKLTPLAKIKHLSESVISILGCNPGPKTLLGTNTYLVGKGKERVLIDTGSRGVPEYQESLSRVLQETNSLISYIIITHHHPDHLGGLADVRKVCNSNVPAYKLESPYTSFRDVDQQISCSEEITYINDNHLFHIDGTHLQAIYNPGHCDDHTILWYEEEKAVFSADSILGEGTTDFTDLSKYMKSLHEIKELNPSIIYPGHGPVVRNPQPHIDYYIKHRHDREVEIVHLLSQSNRSSNSIVQIIYKDYPRAIHPVAAKVVLLHLKKLRDDQRAKCVDELENVDSEWKLIDVQ